MGFNDAPTQPSSSISCAQSLPRTTTRVCILYSMLRSLCKVLQDYISKLLIQYWVQCRSMFSTSGHARCVTKNQFFRTSKPSYTVDVKISLGTFRPWRMCSHPDTNFPQRRHLEICPRLSHYTGILSSKAAEHDRIIAGMQCISWFVITRSLSSLPQTPWNATKQRSSR